MGLEKGAGGWEQRAGGPGGVMLEERLVAEEKAVWPRRRKEPGERMGLGKDGAGAAGLEEGRRPGDDSERWMQSQACAHTSKMIRSPSQLGRQP